MLANLIFLTVLFSFFLSTTKANGNDFEMDFRCSTFLDDGTELFSEGVMNLTSLVGNITTTLIDPNDFTGRPQFSIKINTSPDNSQFLEDTRSPHYFIKDRVDRAQLKFSLKIPSKLKDTMGILMIDGESYEVLCDKTIRQVESYDTGFSSEPEPTSEPQ